MPRMPLDKAVRFAGHTMAEVRSHRLLILRYLVFSVLVISPYLASFRGDGWPEFNKAYIFLAMGLCLLPIVWRGPFFLICLLLIPANLVYMHIDRHWGASGQLDARFEVFLESPPGETIEYLQAHIDRADLALLLCAVAYLVLLFRATFRKHGPSVYLRKIAGVALVGWLAIFVIFRLDQRFASFPPYRLVLNVAEAKERYDLLAGRRDFLEQSPLEPRGCPSKYEKIVIVLGESAISDHMSLFGYPKDTTPFARRSGAHAFNALAPSNQTRYALAMMLTEAKPGYFDAFYRSHSLVGKLRSCGFDTLWISNQGRRGRYDSFSTSLAAEADEQVFLNELTWTEAQLDAEIVTELETRGIFEKTNQATFIHLIGSHTIYNKRYPDGFGFDDLSDRVSEYDNSLLYTDYVLSELYAGFEDDSLLFIYVSDHGQIVSNGKFGSGFLPGYKEEYRIPLLIWSKDAKALETVRGTIDGELFNADSFDQLVLFLIGASTTLEVSTSRTVSILTPENTKEYGELMSLTGH